MNQMRTNTIHGSTPPKSHPTPSRATWRVTAVVITIAMTTAFLTSCSDSVPSQQPAPVVVVGLSANQPRPNLTPAVEKKLVSYATSAVDVGTAIIKLVSAGRIQAVDLTPMRGTQLEQSHPEQVAERNVTQFEKMLAALATTAPGNDPLAALSTAARNAAPGADIYLIGSGLSTVNPIDLRVTGWGVNPTDLAADLSRRGLLPNLSSHNVTFIGLGDTRAPQENLSNPARTKVHAIWTSICAKALAASCTTIAGDLPDVPSATSTATPLIPVPEDPSLAFAAPTAENPVQRLTFNDDTVVRFQPDSATLTNPAAVGHALTPAAAWLKIDPAHKVQITGTTSSEPPSPAWLDNKALALARADAVRVVLVERLGVSVGQIKTSGAGYTANPPDGGPNNLNPERAALNRAVNLVFTIRS